MKQIVLLSLQYFVGFYCLGQNVGIGVAEPQNKLQVHGHLLVNQPLAKTAAIPTPLQTKTMVNAGNITFLSDDSTGYIYDPAGPAANYVGNQAATATINFDGLCAGFEFNIQDIQLGIGDSLIIRESSSSANPAWYAVGNGFSTPGKIIISGSNCYVVFKSNNDGNQGRGFALLFRRLYNEAGLEEPKGHAGNALSFDTKTGSLRSGIFDNTSRGTSSVGLGDYVKASGEYSTAFGANTTASAAYSTAMGASTTADGNYSTTIGYNTKASGDASVAMGRNTTASGNFAVVMGDNAHASGQYSFATGLLTQASGAASIAMGNQSTASNTHSVALGFKCTSSGASSFAAGNIVNATNSACIAMGMQVTANGTNSTALGNYVSTGGFNGAFIIGDNSTTTVLQSGGANSFRSRFVGGYALFTGLGPSTGVVAGTGANSWSAISDVRLKENFVPVNGEDVLVKISRLPLTTWNYIGQDKGRFRHYGPMAQDFYQAFGHDQLGEIGCDTLINQQDFLGVNLVAIQALENRSARQQVEMAELNQRLELLQKKNGEVLEQNIILMAIVEEMKLKFNRLSGKNKHQ